jgi:hypothetical protein
MTVQIEAPTLREENAALRALLAEAVRELGYIEAVHPRLATADFASTLERARVALKIEARTK